MTRPIVFDTMGTTVSLLLASNAPAVAVQRVFTDADARFSLYRPQSEGARVARGDLSLLDASPAFRSVYAMANDWRLATDGAFTPHRPDGAIDLGGIVKSWAMASVEKVLEDHDLESWCLNVGGDVSTRGVQPDGSAWTVGIVDPFDRGRLLTAMAATNGHPAVATSGSAERGDHIWRQGDPADPRFAQVTVAAPDVVMADVLATAIVSAGPAGIDAFTETWPIDVLAVLDDGGLIATPGMRAALLGIRSIG